MENKFTEETSKLTNEQLIKIVTVFRDSYETQAVEAAELEIRKRSGDTGKFEEYERKSYLEETRAKLILRFLNFIIDLLVFCIISIILTLIISLFYLSNYPNKEYPSEEELISYISMAISFFSYYIILEYRYQKTIGKLLTKTKVVTTSGKPLTLSTIILRTFCRLIPFDRLSFLLIKNGFHDSLSGTSVVKDR